MYVHCTCVPIRIHVCVAISSASKVGKAAAQKYLAVPVGSHDRLINGTVIAYQIQWHCIEKCPLGS